MKILGNLTAVGSGISEIQGRSIVTEIKDGVVPSTIARLMDLNISISGIYNNFTTYAQAINNNFIALSGYFYNLIRQHHPSGVSRMEYSFSGMSGIQIINHSLGNTPIIEMVDLSDNNVVIPESVEHIDVNTTKIIFTPHSGIYKIIVVG